MNHNQSILPPDDGVRKGWPIHPVFIAIGLIVVLFGSYKLLARRYGPALYLRGAYFNFTRSELAQLGTELGFYYQDHHSYPSDLRELGGRYKLGLPKIIIETRDMKRPHSYWNSDQVMIFRSRDESNDAGGWGYVNDPKSPEYGTVFVNCTHLNDTGKPWNKSDTESHGW